jgi:aspartate racemase
MKTIGMLGGMSWESTELYYRKINAATKQALGGLHSAPIAMVSVDFQEIEKLQHDDDWASCARILSEKSQGIEAAGADFLIICTNTMHLVAAEIENAIGIPLLHIADATAERIRSAGMKKIGLLGTRFTMEHEFYRGRLEQQGLEVVVPNEQDRMIVHRVIYDELCQGVLDNDSRVEFVRIIEDLHRAGVEGVIEGCTEIAMLVGQEHVDVPLFDTTAIHAEEAVAEALR